MNKNNILAPISYNKIQVALHWLSATLLIVMLLLGSLVLQHLPNDMDKAGPLKVHMIVGGIIAILMLTRLLIRLFTKQPVHVSSNNKMLDFLASATHALLYFLVFAIWGSGVALAMATGIPDVVFDGIGKLPADFKEYPQRHLHGLLAVLLSLFIALHAVGALYHQFVIKDKLMGRMWFNKKTKDHNNE